MPRLMLKPYGYSSGKECELEQAKNLNYKQMVLLDGRRIKSYDELVQIISLDAYKDKEIIEVVLMPMVSGG